METEIWLPVPEIGPTYFVSDQGRVKNGERVLKCCPNVRGYPQVGVRRNGKTKSFKVHRLVMAAFVGPAGTLEVNHINAVKKDNRLVNLEYVSRSENMKHAYMMGLKCSRGENNGQAKVSRDQVEQIRRDHIQGRGGNTVLLAKTYSLHTNQILRISQGLRWLEGEKK